MASSSSNRHWPSMFKSKPCSNHHQWQHDSAASPNCHPKPTPHSSGLEERSPEPKPRWNPRPEQIRILEAIFNSGMVNPPREEIRKIRARLQEYGQVGDANVFYWFQNRKSRSKSKLRGSAAGRSNPQPTLPPATNASSAATVAAMTTSSSSSSSSSPEKSSAASGKGLPVMHSAPPPPPPPPPPITATSLMNSQTYNLPLDLSGIGDHFLNLQYFTGFHATTADISSTALWGELLGQTPNKSTAVQLHQLYGTGPSTTATTTITANPTTEIQGLIGGGGGGRSTVFINEVAFELVSGERLNVKEAFGGEALLLDHSGRPVITNELGITVHPLQHGASYYLA